ncbi:MAG: hypothetical protein IPJ76_05455 [Flavobacteriales bacterium]|nr:MAG: hypothetical protein IPJ76_05455 [Flavobacteriales bacterium]
MNRVTIASGRPFQATAQRTLTMTNNNPQPDLSHLAKLRTRTRRVVGRLRKAPRCLVPTMTPAEVLEQAHHDVAQLLPAVHAHLAAHPCAIGNEMLLPLTSAIGNPWTFLVHRDADGLHVAGLLRYRRMDQRQNALLLSLDGGTAHHFGAELWEHCMRTTEGQRNPIALAGRFLLRNNNHIMEPLGTGPLHATNVVASLNDELVLGVWDRYYDLVHYQEPFRA